MNIISIHAPQLFQIADGANYYYGANQVWYSTNWKRQAGCGPTTCSHLLWYLAKTRLGCEVLCSYDGTSRGGFSQLMEEVWEYVTPGILGVNRTELFTDSAVRYAKEKGVSILPRVLKIPSLPFLRPKMDQLKAFLKQAIAEDLPVGFLNLSNGELKNLESWHWVTVIAMDIEGSMIQIYDQGKCLDIDIELWLRTTLQGGGFVVLEPQLV